MRQFLTDEFGEEDGDAMHPIAKAIFKETMRRNMLNTMKRGRKQGLEKGAKQALQQVARKLLAEKLLRPIIQRLTGLPSHEIADLDIKRDSVKTS